MCGSRCLMRRVTVAGMMMSTRRAQGGGLTDAPPLSHRRPHRDSPREAPAQGARPAQCDQSRPAIAWPRIRGRMRMKMLASAERSHEQSAAAQGLSVGGEGGGDAAGRALLRPTKARRQQSAVVDRQLQAPQALIGPRQGSVDADPVAAVTAAPARVPLILAAAAAAAVVGIAVRTLQRAARGAAPLAATSRLRRTMPNLALLRMQGAVVLDFGTRRRLPFHLACNLRLPR